MAYKDKYGNDTTIPPLAVMKGRSIISVTSAGIAAEAGAFAPVNGENMTCGIYGSVTTGKNAAGGIAAGVIGLDNAAQNLPLAESFGGYFNNLYAGGLSLGAITISNYADQINTQAELSVEQTIGIFMNTVSNNFSSKLGTFILPSNPKINQVFIIISSGIQNGSGVNQYVTFKAPTGFTLVTNGSSNFVMAVYIGSNTFVCTTLN